MDEIVIGCTGHRTLSHHPDRIRAEIKHLFENEMHHGKKIKHVISGFALGFDTLFVEVARQMQIAYIAAVPFIEQADMWPQENKKLYLELLEGAKEIYVQPPAVSGNKIYAGYFGRNKWIVQNSDLLFAYMINSEDGGTAHTWKEAAKKGIRKINLVDSMSPDDPQDEEEIKS